MGPAASILLVERTDDGAAAAVEDVGVDHGRADVAVAEKFLYGPNIVAGFEQVRRERVAQRMRHGGFGDACVADRLTHRALEGLVAQVMAALDATARIDGTIRRRKDILPRPCARCVRILAVQARRQTRPHQSRPTGPAR